jgi:hypothetical protein
MTYCDPPLLRTGAIIILKGFSTIAYSLTRSMGYLALKEFFKSDQFLRLARSNKQTLQLYNISIDLVLFLSQINVFLSFYGGEKVNE